VKYGAKLQFLIDTGANKNFISPQIAKGCKPLLKPFPVQSTGGEIKITHQLSGPFLRPIGNDSPVTFFVLPGLTAFHGIIGDVTLKSLKAIIDRKNYSLTITPAVKIPLLAMPSLNVHSLIDSQHPVEARECLDSLISEFSTILDPLSPGEAVDASVRAEIRTSTQEPIYSNSYPYPANMRGEVENQVDELLREGIIRPSKSPYNSPVCLVPKKPKPNGEKQYRDRF